ncbi:MAG: sigma-70 family RNA polymerase sigma factor [Dehalococcoidales bacterium]|nr:sigma-70 family RNA polymerase sigma factor [Dehalococcoidales bacterium]
MQNSEESLVRQAKEGEKQAFAQLYEAHFERVYRYVAFKIGDRTEAEDMTQQVFLNAYQSLSTFNWKGTPVSAWFFRIAHNQIVDHLRRKEKQTKRQAELSLNESITGRNEDPVAAAELSMDKERLSAATKQLTEAQREVISLRFAGDLPIAEVARIMGKKPGAIKALQHSAVIALRKAFSGREL